MASSRRISLPLNGLPCRDRMAVVAANGEEKVTKPYSYWPMVAHDCTFVTGPTAEKKGLKSSSVASYLDIGEEHLVRHFTFFLSSGIFSDRAARVLEGDSPRVPSVDAHLHCCVSWRVVVLLVNGCAGFLMAKGRVLVAVKRRRRSVRILLAACGDGVCCCCTVVVYGRGDGVCCCCSVRQCAASPAVRGRLTYGCSVLRVKRRISSDIPAVFRA